MQLRFSLVLLALTGCPYVGGTTYDEEIRDADGDGVIGERFGGRDCQDDNPAIGNCDEDDDGFRSIAAGGEDCDDRNAAVRPDAEERCDGIDNDCDGAVDDADPDIVPSQDLFVDADGDGEGDPDRPVACQELADPTNPSSGIHATNADDCNDDDAAVNTAALERCDGFDNDCDGNVDDVGQWPRDLDGDGFGETGFLVAASCDLSTAQGVAAVGGDCDDGDPAIHPDATEIPYDGIDSNCSGIRDDWDVDADGHVPAEHFPAAQAAYDALPAVPVFTFLQGDCDDTDVRVHVDATETCDGVDNDCDGSVDAADLVSDPTEAIASEVVPVFTDADGDGEAGTRILLCPIAIDPAIHASESTDCFDALPAPPGLEGVDPTEVNAALPERCDGFDNNCDTQIDWDAAPFDGSQLRYVDTDDDGYGTTARHACPAAPGFANLPDDCDDGNAGIFPGAPEICGNAVREDCVTEICDDDGLCTPADIFDCDLDGAVGRYLGNTGAVPDDAYDCEDDEPAAFPGNPEVCDGIDNDCNGQTDVDDPNVDITNLPTWYVDDDADGFGGDTTLSQCEQPPGYTLQPGDCDDMDSENNPGAAWYLDGDGDGAGPNGTLTLTGSCTPPPASPAGTWVRTGGDCNDADDRFGPDTLWWRDTDGDGFGDPSAPGVFCSPPVGESYVLIEDPATATEDCNDNDPVVQGNRTFLFDGDGDGFGDPAITEEACTPRSPQWVSEADCDDTDSGINPDQVELCNAVDDDCDGDIDDDDSTLVVLGGGPIGYPDLDNDGFGDLGSEGRMFCSTVPELDWSPNNADCDDTTDAISPAAPEVCGNDVDDDCDGEQQIPLWYVDADGDGFGDADGPAPVQQCEMPAGSFATRSGDCDDDEALSFPGARERDACDGVDDDCDAQSEPALVWTFDGDGDGYGDPATATRLCAPPVERPDGATEGDWLLQGGDCDDTDSAITFGQLYYRDLDRDGVGSSASPQFACPPADPADDVLLVDVDGDGTIDPEDVIGAATSGDCYDDNALVGGPRTFYVDADGDGWGSVRVSPSFTCPTPDDEAPVGFTFQLGDCVDTIDELLVDGSTVDPADIFPGAEDVVDGEDNDCDGFPDGEGGGILWYRDVDGDGFGSDLLAGYEDNAVTVPGDCDDNNRARHPAHPEICDTQFNNDCDASTPDPEVDGDGDGVSVCDGDPDDTDPAIGPDRIRWYLDSDGDGYGGAVSELAASRPSPDHVLFPGDCADADPAVNPDAVDDDCDGIDDDCDGFVDEAAPTTPWYADDDLDGEGAGAPLAACAAPAGFVDNRRDCDDTDELVNTMAAEICDGIDNDCDGLLGADELDADGDGWRMCDDCDDANGARNPGQPEVCDGILDNDCDSGGPEPEIDGDGDGFSVCEGDPDDADSALLPTAFVWYLDADGDGFGGPVTTVAAGAPGPDWTSVFGDCDDDDVLVNPSADDDLCDGVDDDCDGLVDDDVPAGDLVAWHPDADGDGEGRQSSTPVVACFPPVGHVDNAADCNDLDPSVSTDASEVCDGIDNDCDGLMLPDEMSDADLDGVPTCLDCDDADPERFPGNPEVCDGIVDNDCDGRPTDIDADLDNDGFSVCEGDPDDDDDARFPPTFLWYADGDGDGVGAGTPVSSTTRPPGHVVQNGDCDDAAPAVFPGALDDACDGVDQNCNGIDGDDATNPPVYYFDGDGDGFGRSTASIEACDAPAGFVAADGDCNDGDPDTFPGAPELCDGRDNDCVGGVPANETTDGDGDQRPVCADCDDTDPDTYDGAPEICDGRPNNDCGTELVDPDGDFDSDGFSTCEGDPDDTNPAARPPEVRWYSDTDGDGFGAGPGVLDRVAPSTMHVRLGGDCDDADATVFPLATDDTCDGVDQDCTGTDGDDAPAGTRPLWYLDADDDGQGRDGSVAIEACIAPSGYVANEDDCDDADADVFDGASEICDGKDSNCDGTLPADETTDADGDGFLVCEDCQDDEPRRHPGRPEVCDGVLDNNCVADDEVELDNDGDGFSQCQGDPDDSDPGVRPPAQSVFSWYLDDDGDGYGAGTPTSSPTAPSAEHVLIAGDCDDTDLMIFPGAIDLCLGGIDNDCDGVVGNDDTPANRPLWYLDADDDGEGREFGTGIRACPGFEPSGTVDNNDDCDDLDSTVKTSAPMELCDGKDTDCDGTIDASEGMDADGDGALACIDCDDTDPARRPGFPEFCDGIADNDCGNELQDIDTDNDGDGASECEGDPDDADTTVTAPPLAWYLDDDDDGFGGASVIYAVARPGPAYVLNDDDCDDLDPSINPLADDDDCDGIDDNCDGQPDDGSVLDTWFIDADLDGFGDPDVFVLSCPDPGTGFTMDATDCDDADEFVNPGIPEDCDGIDDNCDPSDDGQDFDNDGFFDCEDCDDMDPSVHPGAPELCDGIDNNCDGGVADFGNGSTFDVPNPHQNTSVAVDFAFRDGDVAVMMGDVDDDGTASVDNFEYLCDATFPTATVTITYTNGDPDYTLFPLGDETSFLPNLMAANDCHTVPGDTSTPATGTVVFPDRDGDGAIDDIESPADIQLAGCGAMVDPDFIPFDPVLGFDCDPDDPMRTYQLQDGDFPDRDGDGFVSSTPYDSNNGDWWTDCVASRPTATAAGTDCNDQYADPDPAIGGFTQLNVRDGAALDAALAHCDQAVIALGDAVVYTGNQDPRPGADLILYPEFFGSCDAFTDYGCLDLDGHSLDFTGAGTKLTGSAGYKNGAITMGAGGQLLLDNGALYDVRIDSDSDVDLRFMFVSGPSDATAITSRANNVWVDQSTFVGKSSTVGIELTSGTVRLTNSDLGYLATGVRLIDGGTVDADQVSFEGSGTEVGIEALDSVNQFTGASCTTCGFGNMGVGLRVAGDFSDVECRDCTVTGFMDTMLVDAQDDSLQDPEVRIYDLTVENPGASAFLPLIETHDGQVTVERASIANRILLHTQTNATLQDVRATGLNTSELVDASLTSSERLDVVGLDVDSSFTKLIRASGQVELRDSVFQNVSTVVTSEHATPLELTVDGIVIDGFGDAFELTRPGSTGTFADVEATQGQLFLRTDDSTAFIEDFEGTGLTHWIRAAGASNVTVFDAEYSDSPPGTDIGVDGGSQVDLLSVRMLDVSAAGQWPIAVAGEGGPTQAGVRMDDSLVWATGQGRLAFVDNGDLVLFATTFHGTTPGTDSGLMGGGTFGLITANQSIFYTTTPTSTCIVDGSVGLTGFGNWTRVAPQTCGQVTAGWTLEDTTGNANFSSFTRLPTNPVVRGGWGEVSN
jgi:hypothetical protein